MKTYKAIIMMLILVFSLSPCSVKRNVLDIFDIQYISGLNKVKTTSGFSSGCDISSNSSRLQASKSEAKFKKKDFFLTSNLSGNGYREEQKISFHKYSGHTTGSSPPKYILFKRLKISLV
ncbi:hypothetical protein [Chryseobacterium pennipullorum]|nr:hypothetical protein [Chryseobacterium pennipullorum]